MKLAAFRHDAICYLSALLYAPKVTWAGKHSRFTLLFEGFAVRVLQAARSLEEACKLSGLNWHQVNAIRSPYGAAGVVTATNRSHSL